MKRSQIHVTDGNSVQHQHQYADESYPTAVAPLFSKEEHIETNNWRLYFHLGLLHYHGQGCVANKELSGYYFKVALGVLVNKAADDAEAQYHLGLIYENGYGHEVNQALAVKCYQLAALQSHVMAYSKLDALYYYGEGADWL